MTVIVKAKQDEICDWCGETIHAGKNIAIRQWKETSSTIMMHWHFHPDCTYKGGYIPKSMLTDNSSKNSDTQPSNPELLKKTGTDEKTDIDKERDWRTL